MSVRRVPAYERLHGLVHVDAIDAVPVQHRVRDASILGAPEGRGHVHGGARLGVENVVRLLAHAAILFLHRPAGGVLARPAGRAGAPEPLVHVDHGVAPRGVRGGERGAEGVDALPRREVVGKARVVWTVMPPVPVDADRQAERPLQGERGRHDAGRATTVPHPHAGVEQPVGNDASAQPALARPGLARPPRAVALGHRDPVALERPEERGVGRCPLRAGACWVLERVDQLVAA